MYKRFLTVTFAIIALTVILSILPVHGEEQLYDSVLRLHVLANSDSREDQELKLRVRDGILEHSGVLLSNVDSREEAERILTEAIPQLTEVARATVAESGYNYAVSIELGYEAYPTRSYESCCFPSGEYLSLRVKIGNAEGQNWWCVLFPPLCLSGAVSGDGYISAGLDGEQFNIITQTNSPKYKVRFKLLEAFEKAARN